MQESLGRRLRVMRAERGLSLREAARRAGVVKETISDIERGHTHPYDVTLAKLAHAYGVPVEDLLEEPELAGAGPGKADAQATGQPEAEAPETGPPTIKVEVPDAIGVSDEVSVRIMDELAMIVDAWRAGLKSDAEAEQEVRELVA